MSNSSEKAFVTLINENTQKPAKQKKRTEQETSKWMGKEAEKHGHHVSGSPHFWN